MMSLSCRIRDMLGNRKSPCRSCIERHLGELARLDGFQQIVSVQVNGDRLVRGPAQLDPIPC